MQNLTQTCTELYRNGNRKVGIESNLIDPVFRLCLNGFGAEKRPEIGRAVEGVGFEPTRDPVAAKLGASGPLIRRVLSTAQPTLQDEADRKVGLIPFGMSRAGAPRLI